MGDRWLRAAQAPRRCRFCNRGLRDELSRRVGAGPCCRRAFAELLEFEAAERAGQDRLPIAWRFNPKPLPARGPAASRAATPAGGDAPAQLDLPLEMPDETDR